MSSWVNREERLRNYGLRMWEKTKVEPLVPLSDGGCRVRGWVKLSHRGNRETWESEAVMMIRGPWGFVLLWIRGVSSFGLSISRSCPGLELLFFWRWFLGGSVFLGTGFLVRGNEMACCLSPRCWYCCFVGEIWLR